MEQDRELLAGRASWRVRVEPPEGSLLGFVPFEAVLHPRAGAGLRLVAGEQHALPELTLGDRLLLVDEGTTAEGGQDEAVAVKVLGPVDLRTRSVSVTADGAGTRPGRRQPRTPVEGAAVVVAHGGVDVPGELVDVSLTGMHVEFQGIAQAPREGTACTVAGVVPAVQGGAPWQVWGTVVWSRQFYRWGSCGIRIDEGQRRTITRIVRWARVQELRGSDGAPPLP